MVCAKSGTWRVLLLVNRLSAMEENLIAYGFENYGNFVHSNHPELHAALTAARTFAVDAKQFALLSIYEQRMQRSLQKNIATLRSLQAERKERQEKEMVEGAELLQLNEMKGLP